MDTYCRIIREKTKEDIQDTIIMEEFKYDESAHPRSVILIRKSNGEPVSYYTNTLYQILQTTGKNPWTNEVFPEVVKQRIRLYQECVREFPEYSLEKLDVEDLYNRMLESIQVLKRVARPDEKKLAEKTLLEAQCFLQVEDLHKIFQRFGGSEYSSVLSSRVDAEKYLTTKNLTWILRNSSVVDTDYNKAFVLSIRRNDGTFAHVLILHLIGEGFYSGVCMTRGARADTVFDKTQVKCYPTIVHLLQNEIYALHI